MDGFYVPHRLGATRQGKGSSMSKKDFIALGRCNPSAQQNWRPVHALATSNTGRVLSSTEFSIHERPLAGLHCRSMRTKRRNTLNTNPKHLNGYTCFKQCGFVGQKLSDMYAHYKAEPTHHRNYGDAKALKRQKDKIRKQRERRQARTHSHLSVVGSKVKIGQEVGFKANGHGGSRTGLPALRKKVALEITEAYERIQTLRAVEEFLNKEA